MPRRGTSNSSPGRNSSFTDRGSETGSTQRKYTLSQLTPQRAGLLSSPPSPPPRSGGPACTGPPQWTTLIPPLTSMPNKGKFALAVALFLISFAASGVGLYRSFSQPLLPQQEPIPEVISNTSIGVHRDVADRYVYVGSTVTGTNLAEEYAKHNYVGVICRSPDNKIDPLTDTVIDESKPFNMVEGLSAIEVRLGDAATKRVLFSGYVDIYLVMIPKEVQQTDLLTLKDVTAHGGRILSHTGMGTTPRYLLDELNKQ
jgi:hypothetical protein